MVDMGRAKKSWMRLGFIVGLVVACLAAPLAADKRPYARFVVFGTSFSDPGNAFALIGGNNNPPSYDVDALLLPDEPYARGGHHLTNGPTWIEQLARPLGLSASVNPAFRTDGVQGTNYAIGASRSVPTPGNASLPLQVDFFLSDVRGVAPSDALYVVEMGANDISDALSAVSQGQSGAAILNAAVVSIAGEIQRLYAAGARHFLVGNVPSAGYSPAVRTLDQAVPGTAALARLLTMAFNAGLSSALDLLEGLPGIDITRVDAFQLVDEIIANPTAFGLTNVQNACITPNVPPFKCGQPDRYFFWDGVHPTTAVHTLVAGEAASVLGLD